MPRYFFNTRIGDELIGDPEGDELRNLDRAWEVARAMIREVLRIEGAQPDLLTAVIEVTDDDGEIVLEFPFAEALIDMPDERITRHYRPGRLSRQHFAYRRRPAGPAPDGLTSTGALQDGPLNGASNARSLAPVGRRPS
jgi:hypothetical protein